LSISERPKMVVASVTRMPRVKLWRGGGGGAGGMGYIMGGMGGIGGICGDAGRGGTGAPEEPGGGGTGLEKAPDGSIGGSELGGWDELMAAYYTVCARQSRFLPRSHR
jgi:hypothetical protein